jgi:hypothetical protein
MGCAHEVSEHYQCQSDWGYDHFCTHPSITRKPVSVMSTPEWCPLMPPDKDTEIATLRATMERLTLKPETVSALIELLDYDEGLINEVRDRVAKDVYRYAAAIGGSDGK